MKVKFLKNYKHTIKTFKKGAIVELHHGFANQLIKKKVAEATDEVSGEEKAIKLLNKE